mgnify:CR=1 FL=1
MYLRILAGADDQFFALHCDVASLVAASFLDSSFHGPGVALGIKGCLGNYVQII